MAERCGRVLAVGPVLLLITGCLAPQPARPLPTFDQLLGDKPLNFGGWYDGGLRWMKAGGALLHEREGVLQRVDPVTDAATPAYDWQALRDALKAHPDFDAGAAEHLARHPTRATDDYAAVLLEHAQELYFYRFSEGVLRKLSVGGGARRELTLSPTGGYAAFVRDSDLYTVDTETGRTARLTQDGSETLLNGLLDWVYQEEVYGRGNWRAYWWSDDGERLAFLRLDVSREPIYPLVDYLPRHPEMTPLRWPKAGDPNATLRLGIVRAAGGEVRWVDLSPYDQQDILIVGVSWSPDGHVLFAVQDRESRWLELNDVGSAGGAFQTLIREDSPAWFDYEGPPRWLRDGTFLWSSARDGWEHLYHYDRDGRLIGRVTAGPWEARAVHGVDPVAGVVYVSGTYDSPVEEHLYRVPLAGGRPVRLTDPGLDHDVKVDPQFAYFVDEYGDVRTPTRVALRDREGRLVRMISRNDVAELLQYRLSLPELLRIAPEGGPPLNGVIVRPLNRRPDRKYPVFCIVYGGPHMPIVRNRWRGEFNFMQWLAQHGCIAWICDPYSASGEGAVSAWTAWQRLGETEVRDLERSLAWLAEHEQADLARVAIHGHSYGGYLTAYALTHSRMFSVGIAGAALTDWRNYDTIYAEKLMRTPANNRAGYDRASAVTAAADLRGCLLLVHGGMDDNVHLQNTMQFVDALLRAGKDFELMIYPRDDHGIWRYEKHWPRTHYEYIARHLW